MAKRKKKISDKQLKANRENAQKSPGPVTQAGKQKVSGNAGKHFFYSKNAFLPGEDPQAYDALLKDLARLYRPQNLVEWHHVKRIRDGYWRLNRILAYETMIWDNLETCPNPFQTLNQLSLLESRLEKMIQRAEKAIEDAQFRRHQADKLEAMEATSTQPKCQARVYPKNNSAEASQAHLEAPKSTPQTMPKTTSTKGIAPQNGFVSNYLDQIAIEEEAIAEYFAQYFPHGASPTPTHSAQ